MDQQQGVSYKQIRVLPAEGSFDTSGNAQRATFNVPNSNYDLSQSSLIVRAKVNVVSNQQIANSGGDVSGIFDTGIFLNNSSDAHTNFSSNVRKNGLIKNCQVSNDKLGQFDNANRHNQFMANVNALLLNEDDQMTEIYNGNTINGKELGLTLSNPISLLHREGTVLSEERSIEMVVPLKSVLNSHVIDNYQSSVHGANLQYNFELLLNQLTGAAITAGDTVFTTRYNNNVDNQNNAVYGALDPLGAAGADTDITVLTTSIKYDSLALSPFYTGMKVLISYTLQGSAAVVDQVAKIVAIDYLNSNDANNGKLQLTFSHSIVTQTQNNTLTGISLKACPAQSASVDIQGIELKMMELVNAASIKLPQQLTYERIKSDNDGYVPSQAVTRNYYIPPRCKTVFVTFPETALLGASRDQISNYRIIVDNEPITDSEVLFNSSKHHDLIGAGFRNAGAQYQLKNLLSNMKDFNFAEDGSGNNNVFYTVLAFPVPFKNEQQVMNIELNADANMSGNIQLNYQVVEQVTVQ